MRVPIPHCAVLLVLACGPAAAQVTVEPHALDALQPPVPQTQTSPAAPAHRAPAPARPVRPPPRPARTGSPGTATPARPAAKPSASAAPPPAAAPPPPPPVVPAAPPPPPVIPPPIVVPVRPVSPPLPAIITPGAPGTATPIPGGASLTFGPDSAELNPATAAALRSLARNAAPDATFSLAAYAAGAPEDPSTPRRLSLERALAARSVLIGEGIASTRIYPRALGAGSAGFTDGPPDRVDVIVSAPTPAPAPSPSQPGPSQPTAPQPKPQP